MNTYHHSRLWGFVAVTALLLTACQSAAPIRFYTLLPAASVEAPPAQDPAFRIDLAAVAIPSQVDTARIVVREGGGRLTPVEGQRWIAPLADEVRAGLAAALSRRLGVPEVGDLAVGTAAGLPLYRVRVSLRRFESMLGRSAQIEATWTVSSAADPKRTATCESRREVSIGPGFEALAEGHQRALISLADGIAAGLESLHAGRDSNVCVAANPG